MNMCEVVVDPDAGGGISSQYMLAPMVYPMVDTTTMYYMDNTKKIPSMYFPVYLYNYAMEVRYSSIRIFIVNSVLIGLDLDPLSDPSPPKSLYLKLLIKSYG